MKILLDTHVFLWAITGDSRLSAAHTKLYLDEENELFLSLASLWEMLIKAGLGRLPLPKPATAYLLRQLEKNRVNLLPLRPAHLAELEQLPPLHRDPFDRMLVAQSRAEKMPLLTQDDRIREYAVDLL